MREKIEGERAKSEIRGNSERMRVSTKTKAKTEALGVTKARSEIEAKEITYMDKSSTKTKAKVGDEGIEGITAGSKAGAMSKLKCIGMVKER